MNSNASNVLLCLRYGIGDLVMELPALDRLREVLPHARITGLGAEPAIEILDGDTRLDEIVPIQRWGLQHLGDAAEEAVLQEFAEWLAESRFDTILDPSHAAHTIRRIIHRQETRIYDSDAACLETGLAQGLDGLTAIKCGTHQGWGLELPASSHPMIHLRPEETAWATGFLTSSRVAGADHSGGELLAVSPGASHDLKRWSAEGFAQLCRFAAEELQAAVLVFGGPGESRILRDLADRIRSLPRVEIVQNLHLRRVAALLSCCTLYVGNDSGLMHLAAGTGTPVVALFGPTVPHLYLPRWVPSHAVVSRVACPFRPRRAFGHPRCVLAGRCLIDEPCIQTIELSAVLDAVRSSWIARDTSCAFPRASQTEHHTPESKS